MTGDLVHDRNYLLFIGRTGSGKSTLASEFSLEHLVLDFDGRWFEQGQRNPERFHIVPNDIPTKMVSEMERMRPGLQRKVGTVIVDSGTSLLDFETSYDRLRNVDAPDKKWMNEAFKRKADMMRVLSGAVLRWQCNVIWIFHIDDTTDRGVTKTRQTIPHTELERLKKSLNAEVEVFSDGKRRGLKIVWCRYNNNQAAGQILWDTEGWWKGMPWRLHSFMRSFTGSEGYNGNAYSLAWLQSFLQGKGVAFVSQEEMCTKLEITTPPLWFDRGAWAELVVRAGIQ